MTMISRYPGTCRNCRERFSAGTEINWTKEDGASHAAPCTKATVADPGVSYKTQPDKLVPGVYETTKGIFVVKPSKENPDRLYAKRLVELKGKYRATEAGPRADFEFEYAPGAVYDLKLSDRMPLDRAKELITLYGRCIACNRHLKAAKSVEQGIGTVCIKRFGPVLKPVVETADGRRIVRAA